MKYDSYASTPAKQVDLYTAQTIGLYIQRQMLKSEMNKKSKCQYNVSFLLTDTFHNTVRNQYTGMHSISYAPTNTYIHSAHIFNKI